MGGERSSDGAARFASLANPDVVKPCKFLGNVTAKAESRT